MKKKFFRILAFFLAMIMIASLLPVQVFADSLNDPQSQAEGNDPIVVIAGSDFQDPDGHLDSSSNVSSILTAIKQRYATAYGFLFAGDYDYSYGTAADGLSTLKETVQSSGMGFVDQVYVQGNHDPEDLLASGDLTAGGDNDTEHYGVYVINEQDYMHNNTDAAAIRDTADALNTYLSAKVAENYEKPIFVVSHLPLHYSMRTYRDGDAMYADKIFNVLNKAGEQGLNIIFLYGHNHSHGWDDYMGGSSVFLRPGNVLLVADSSKTEFSRHTLSFTYMNAGFVGYYQDMGSGADTALTMSVFEIYDDRVEINRLDANGAHRLKGKGYYGADYDLDEVESSVYDPLTRVYEHTETIYLHADNGGVIAPEYAPEGTDHGWIQISSNSNTVWRASSTLTAGKRYIIVDDYIAGEHRALAKNSMSAGLTYGDVTVHQDSKGNYITDVLDQEIWTYSGNKFKNSSYRNTTYYLRGDTDELRTTTRSNDTYTTWKLDANYGLYTTRNNNGTKYYMGDAFDMNSRGSRTDRVYLFVEETVETPTLYASFKGAAGVTLPANVYANQSDIMTIIHESFTVFTATDSNGSNQTVINDYEIVGTVNTMEEGVYTLSIRYKGVEITKYVVTMKARQITSIDCSPMNGYATLGSTTTGSILTVTYSDGSTSRQYVTIDMLSGNFSLRDPGTYENLSIVYGDRIISGYTLNVYVNNYPEFPHEGSVRVNKGATGIDFNHTGVAKIDLSATGVPVKRGADVIIMLDTSSSMEKGIGGVSRIDVLNESLTDLVNDFKRDGEDGTPMDIRLAIADFNNYYSSSSSPYYLNSNDRLNGTTSRGGSSSPDVDVYTGDGSLSAGALVSVHDLTVRSGRIYDENGDHIVISTSSGTNYDYAFDAVYQLAHSVKKANEETGEDRDLFVIFMSDGAPFQYNYYSSQSEASNWNNWLLGTATNSMFPSSANKNYYNEDGRHWMAEAIKGDPDKRYTVVRKNTNGLSDVLQSAGSTNMYTLPGLGATMFSIGFCLEQDKQIQKSTMSTVLKNISSDPELLYYEANNADDLHSAFHMIGQEINYAATDAYFVDTMGLNFQLQTSIVNYNVNGDGRTIIPDITFTLYGLYTLADVEAGLIPYDQIGTRNGRSTVVETVSFNVDGTEAYSNGSEENILINGVIYGHHFWYNTNDYSVMIDTNQDGIDDYLLPNETFYWKMGTINQHDMVLSYYTYLEGSMEGTLTQGIYETNQSAILYYKNWLGNDAYRETISPQIAWNKASVRYAFYLVDENGHPLVNQEMGLTGSFANRINLINPTMYSELRLNSDVTLNAAALAVSTLPEGFELYDSDATFTLYVGDNPGDGSWTITKGNNAISSTYVTGHNSYQFSNALAESDPVYDYSHTIVWFAVVYSVKPVSDVVVIDYALPVDIPVLLNDMFYNKGGVVAVGPAKNNGSLSGDTILDPEFSVNGSLRTTYEGKFGTATITPSGIRYTLNKGSGTNMTEPEVFSYAVLYGTKYFYGTITVIPATTLYFEESFLDYENANGADEFYGTWADVGEADSKVSQGVDRPGFNNLSSLDANNIYGFDGAYTTGTTFSNGGGKVITVNESVGSAANAPYASFTFTGTGFDVISMTDHVSGTILVTVTDATGKQVASKAVNTYYGYTYSDENGWQPDANSNDAIWQVPVIKFSGLEKGTYTVRISVIYLTNLRDLYPNGSCTFVLDSVRIYDSAKGNADADAAHKADKEYAPYYLNMKDIVVGSADVQGANTIPGVVFIDGKDAVVSMEDYEIAGPSNELYLAIGQGISFKLTATVIPSSVQIGAKMAYGTDAVIKHGSHNFLHVHGTSDMYYKITHLTWTPVTDDNDNVLYYVSPVITLSHSDRNYFHDTSAVLSLTGFKFTFEEDNAMIAPLVDADTIESGIAVMTSLYAADADLDNENEAEEETTAPENETAPETTVPENTTEQPADEKNDETDAVAEDTESETNGGVDTEPESKPAEDQAQEDASAESAKGCGAVLSAGSVALMILLAAYAFVSRKRQ